MPDPIMLPMTRATAIQNPRTRAGGVGPRGESVYGSRAARASGGGAPPPSGTDMRGANYIVTPRAGEIEPVRTGLFGLGQRSGLPIHFLLRPEDAAPVFVLGHGHAAFDADTDPLARLAFAGEQFREQGHRHSPNAFGRMNAEIRWHLRGGYVRFAGPVPRRRGTTSDTPGFVVSGWGTEELENWGAGELGSWRTGELPGHIVRDRYSSR